MFESTYEWMNESYKFYFCFQREGYFLIQIIRDSVWGLIP